MCTYTDYFVIATGQNPRQTKAIHDEVHATLKQDEPRRCRPRSTASAEATWIVADYLDVVLHVFTPEARKYYALEDLWGDVPSFGRGRQAWPRPSASSRTLLLHHRVDIFQRPAAHSTSVLGPTKNDQAERNQLG